MNPALCCRTVARALHAMQNPNQPSYPDHKDFEEARRLLQGILDRNGYEFSKPGSARIRRSKDYGKRRPNLTPAQVSFFGVEIRNDHDRRGTESTLDSALGSLVQTPNDIVLEWMRSEFTTAERETGEADTQVQNLKDSIHSLIAEYGRHKTLADLLK